MTIINTSHKFIYIHIPKTAGTSVKRFLSNFTRYCDVEVGGSGEAELIAPYYGKRFGLRKHSLAQEIRTAMGEADFNAFFKFAMVRSPFTRTVSTFKFLKYTWRVWKNSAVMDEFATVEEFVASDFFKTPGPDRIFEPQTRWLLDAEGGKLVDFIGRVESLNDDMASVCERLKLPRDEVAVERRNVSKAGEDGGTAAEITGAMVDAIRERYSRDFEVLDYSRDPDGVETGDE